MINLCQHGLAVCSRCVIVTEAAKRMADQINARITFMEWDQLRTHYMAFRLEDGTTDGNLYETKRDAARHTDEKRCCYFWFGNAMGGVTARDMQIFLNMQRHARDRGMPMADPDDRRGGPDIIVPTGYYDSLFGRRRNVQN